MTEAAALTDEVFRAAADRDLVAATTAVQDRLAGGARVATVLSGLAEAQVRVGERWYTDEWSIADAHAATAIVDAALSVVDASVGRGSPAAPSASVVVACPEGEWHALPARMLATDLRSLGAEVLFLGSSMPAEHLVRCAEAHRPHLLALSITTALGFGAAASAIDALRAAGVPVVLGGRALGASDRRARALGADGWSADAAGVLGTPLFAPSAADAAARRRERERTLRGLALDRPALVEAAVAELARRIPAMAGFDRRRLARTRESLWDIAGFADAAILVDDPSLFVELIRWLGPLLAARGVPAGAVDASLDALISVSTDGVLRDVLATPVS